MQINLTDPIIHEANNIAKAIIENKPSEMRKRFLDILKKFTRRAGLIKSDNLNISIFRAHRKLIRCIVNNTLPRGGAIKLTLSSFLHAKIWTDMCEIFRKNPSLFEEKSKIEDPQKSEHKSFNKIFLRIFYSDPLMREMFICVIDLLFCDENPEVTCKKLKLLCCKNKIHEKECREKIDELKLFLKTEYLGMFNSKINICPENGVTVSMILESTEVEDREYDIETDVNDIYPSVDYFVINENEKEANCSDEKKEDPLGHSCFCSTDNDGKLFGGKSTDFERRLMNNGMSIDSKMNYTDANLVKEFVALENDFDAENDSDIASYFLNNQLA